MTVQNYENSWKLTVEYPDIHGKRFLGTLKIIVDFGSIRKSINQFVTLGFVNYHLTS